MRSPFRAVTLPSAFRHALVSECERMATFDITTNNTDIAVPAGSSTQIIFTVTNLQNGPVEGNLIVEWDDGAGGDTWAEVVDGKLTAFAARESRRITVNLMPPADAPESALTALHRFRLVVLNVSDGSGDRGVSPAAHLRLRENRSASSFPWLIVAIVAAVVVLGGVGTIFALTNNGEDPPVSDRTPVQTVADAGVVAQTVKTGCRSDHDCTAPKVCHGNNNGTEGRCVLPAGGRGCNMASDCATQRCNDGVCVGALVAAGGECADDSACEGDLVCHQNRCRINADGYGCSSDQHCVTNKCRWGRCVSSLPGLHKACMSKCQKGLTCWKGHCLYADGQRGCRTAKDCTTGHCASGICRNVPKINERCSGTCGKWLTCVRGVCKRHDNRGYCPSNSSCISGYCVKGICRKKRKMTYTPHINYPGKDYAKAVGLSPTQCRSRCQTDERCKAYTWVRPGVQGKQSYCWLKSSVPRAVKDTKCISGVKR